MKFPHEKLSLLFLALIELIAGSVIIFNLETVLDFPIILFLIPALMNLRGAVYGVLMLRIIKLLTLGLIKPSFKERKLRKNIATAFFVGTISSSIIAIIAYIFENIYFQAKIGILELLTLSVLTNFLSFFILTFPLIFLLFYHYKKGKSLEFIGAPYVAAVSDAITPFVLFVSFNLIFITLFQILFLFIIFIILFIIILRKFLEKEYIKENLSVISITTWLSGLGGIFYARVISFPEIQNILIAAPAFNALLGGIGGILASRLSISFHLGSSSKLLTNISYIKSAYFVFFLGLIFSSIFAGINGLIIILIASLFSIFFITLITYYVSLTSFKRGLDPDNVTLPIVTTSGDLLGPASVIIVFLLFF
jgi:mgtE-like transporter